MVNIEKRSVAERDIRQTELMVASLTFNRPEGLANLLEAFSGLKAPERSVFLIIDNSPEGNARELITSAGARGAIDLRYVHEPKPGISAGRNRALAEASAVGARWLAFIDDDEWPEPDWLSHLIAAQLKTGAAAVVGPVEGHLPSGAPAWLERGDFFSFHGPEDGAEITEAHAATNNALIDFFWVQHAGLQFDPSFGLSGGEDTMFFRSLRQHGGSIVFARSALVHETITSDRTRLTWLFTRWRRGGNAQARIDMVLAGRSRWQIAAGGLARFGAGGFMALVLLPAVLVGRFDLVARGLRILCHGVGRFDAACGGVVIEYKRVASKEAMAVDN